MYSLKPSVIKNVLNSYSELKLLNSCIIVDYDILISSTNYSETIDVTEEKQFRCHGLIHIYDSCYEFVMDLEQERIRHLTSTNLARYGENIVQHLYENLSNHTELEGK